MRIDSHAHLTCDTLYGEIEEIVARAKLAQVESIVNICTDPITLERGLKLQEQHPWIYNAGATTPHDVEKDGKEHFPIFEKAAREGKLIAIGETGLDYFYEHSAKELQKQFLIQYLTLAKELNLPTIIHCREAFEDLFSIIDAHHPDGKVILHCFTGTTEEALEVVKRGWWISFSGILTFKKSSELRETLKQMPLEHILIETDAPYLAPGKYRGKTNETAYITETYECMVQVTEIPAEELQKQLIKNFNNCFFKENFSLSKNLNL